MQLNSHNLQTVGRFFDSNTASITDRAVLYVINDTHYRIDEDGCWYFADEPNEMGWSKCDPPAALKDLI